MLPLIDEATSNSGDPSTGIHRRVQLPGSVPTTDPKPADRGLRGREPIAGVRAAVRPDACVCAVSRRSIRKQASPHVIRVSGPQEDSEPMEPSAGVPPCPRQTRLDEDCRTSRCHSSSGRTAPVGHDAATDTADLASARKAQGHFAARYAQFERSGGRVAFSASPLFR